MEKNRGKQAFEAIEIPDELEDTVQQGIRRGARRRAFARTVTGLAAAVLLVFTTANVPPLYAGAADVPLFGTLVRIMHVGSGGEALENVYTREISERDMVRITFADRDGNAVAVPAFSTACRELPRRMTLRLHGLAKENRQTLAETLLEQEAVKDAWPLASTDPMEQGVTVELAAGWDAAVSQYEQTLELRFIPSEAEKAQGYVLCSEPMDFGQGLAELTESLLWEGATQLETESGFRVLVGEYRTRRQAERARAGLYETRGVDLRIGEMTDGILNIVG